MTWRLERCDDHILLARAWHLRAEQARAEAQAMRIAAEREASYQAYSAALAAETSHDRALREIADADRQWRASTGA